MRLIVIAAQQLPLITTNKHLMKILDRYILRELLPVFFLCITAFLSLYVIIDLFSRIDEVFKQQITFSTIAMYYIMFSPVVLIQIIPLALLLSVLYTLGAFAKNNELIAMRAAGITLWKTTTPLILFGILISLACFFLNTSIVPAALKRSAEIEENDMNTQNTISTKIIENVTFYGKNNSLFYAKSFDTFRKVLNNVTILQHDNERNLTSKTIASSGTWQEDHWEFYTCTIITVDPLGQMISDPVFFPEYTIDLGMRPRDIMQNHLEIDAMSLEELRQYIEKLHFTGGKTLERLRTEFHYKIAFPFACIAIIFVGIPIALGAGRNGTWVGIGISLMTSFAYYILMAFFLAMGKGGILPPIYAAWSVNIVFFCMGCILFIRVTRFS